MTRTVVVFAACLAGCASPARLVQSCPAETLGGATLGAALGYLDSHGALPAERTAWVLLAAASVAGSTTAPCRRALRRHADVERRLGVRGPLLDAARIDLVVALERETDHLSRQARLAERQCWTAGPPDGCPGAQALSLHADRLQATADQLVTPAGLVASDVVRLGEDEFAVRLVLPADALVDDASGRLRPQAGPLLDAIASALDRVPAVDVLAYTSASSDPRADIARSLDVALAVRDALQDRLRSTVPVYADGLGAGEAVAAVDSPTSRAANRRVELLLLQ
ncbi:hypothetical protein [Rubrivirga sp. IMCC43871]|uniref:hypothetical protein n=1 Tax=Rubrivirga sp. IMCC43871 TaxID=3391575 RepID=UPI0039902320